MVEGNIVGDRRWLVGSQQGMAMTGRNSTEVASRNPSAVGGWKLVSVVAGWRVVATSRQSRP
ncbi:unnamed protein product [Prunus armeniaca]